MKEYLLSIYQPDGPPPATTNLEHIMRDVGAVRDEMQAANAWVFSGGLHEASSATVLRPKGAELLITDGPFIEGKEHLGGFTIVRAVDLDAAWDGGGNWLGPPHSRSKSVHSVTDACRLRTGHRRRRWCVYRGVRPRGGDSGPP